MQRPLVVQATDTIYTGAMVQLGRGKRDNQGRMDQDLPVQYGLSEQIRCCVWIDSSVMSRHVEDGRGVLFMLPCRVVSWCMCSTVVIAVDSQVKGVCPSQSSCLSQKAEIVKNRKGCGWCSG